MADEPIALSVQITPSGARLVYQDLPLRAGPSDLSEEALGEGTIAQLGTLASLCRDLLLEHGAVIEFGPVLAGAIYELRLAKPPQRVFLRDGYLVVHLPDGAGHLHLGVGASRENARIDPSGELGRARRCTRAALFEGFAPHAAEPCTWGVRLWNGEGAQMITFFIDPEAGPRVLASLRERYLRRGRPC